jgi:hypothetical protein
MEVSTNAVVERKLEPMVGTVDKARTLLTGQFVYDNFVKSDDTQVSRMNQMRVIVETGLTADELKGALKDAVEIAHKVDVAAGVPEKERGSKRQQAMNVRTIMQNAYGALKLARVELEALGYSNETGYQEMRVLAKKALDAKGVKWDGKALPTDETKRAAKEAEDKAALKDAMATALTEMGDYDGDDLIDRVKARRDEIVLERATETQKRLVSKHTDAIVKQLGESLALLVAESLITLLTSTTSEEE